MIPLGRPVPDRAARWPGVLLGFAMGGFFDGILLHQILQWHHLLSAIQVGPLGSLSAQVTVDGWFHALMYAVAAVGLWQLYRLKTSRLNGASIRGVWPAFWIGFGGWHIIDAVFSHWVTGIHRIKMDSDIPLIWDMAWFVLFGVLPVLLGWWKQSASSGGDSTTGSHKAGSVRMLTVVVLASAVVNLFPLRGNNDTTVVTLSQGTSVVEFFDALDRSDARVLWAGAQGDVWVVQGLTLKARIALYSAGALYVSGTAAPAGCAAWLELPSRRPLAT